MSRSYDVDDILAEIKRKKKEEPSFPARPAAPAQPREEPPARPEPQSRPRQTAPAQPLWEEPPARPEPRNRPRQAAPAQPLWEEPPARPEPQSRPRQAAPVQPRWEEPAVPAAPRQWDDGPLEPAGPARPVSPYLPPDDSRPHLGSFSDRWARELDEELEDETLRKRGKKGKAGRKGRALPEDEPPQAQGDEVLSPLGAFGSFQEIDDEGYADASATRLDLPQARPAGRGVVALHQPDEEDDELPGMDADELEYRSPADAKAVWKDLYRLKTGLLVRLLVTVVCSGLLIYLALSYDYPLPLPPFMWPENNLTVYFISCMVVLIIPVIVCSNTIGGGLISLVTLKADNDSFASVATLAALIQGAALIIAPEQAVETQVHIYLPVAALALVFNTLGKLLIAGRVTRSFQVVAGERRAGCTTSLIPSKDLAREMTRGQNLDIPKVAHPVEASFLSSFLELSYEEDYSDGVARVLAPVSLGASLLMALVSFIFSRDVFIAITVFTAALCACAPFSALLVGNMPLGKLAKRLRRDGSMVSGYGAVERFSEANAVVLRCSDLFPADSLTLHGIKVFAKTSPDEAILDAASVICSVESTLTGVFTQMIGGRTEMLKTVENLTYEDGMGLSAWVGGKRVLIGNRELMRQHGIEIPSRDFEAKYRQGDRELLYLSNSGELTAMYVLSYNGVDAVADVLALLADENITLVVYSTDPNITPRKIEEVLEFPADLVKIMPAKLHAQYLEQCAPRDRAHAYMAHDGSPEQFIRTLLETRICRSAVSFGAVLQMVFVVMGFALVTFFAFMQNMGAVTWMLLAAFQVVACLVVAVFPNLRRL